VRTSPVLQLAIFLPHRTQARRYCHHTGPHGDVDTKFDYGTYEALMLARPLSSKLTQGQRIAMTTTIAQNATWRTFANLSLVDRRNSVSLSIEDVRMGWAVEKRRGASVFEYNHQNPEGLHFLI
jgi:hypothetical protein